MTQAQFKETHHFPALDGLRAVAAILVIKNHIPMLGPLFNYVDGPSGVTLFFVLSGFLITTLALREEEQRGALSWQAFAIRRAWRIFPAYYVVLGLYCLLIFTVFPSRKPDFLAALPYYAVYLNEFGIHAAPNPAFGQSWTLGIEEKFYLVWPVVAFVMLRGAPRLRLGIAVAAAVVTFGSGIFVLAQYGAILCGCTVAFVLHLPEGYRRLSFLGRPWVQHGVARGPAEVEGQRVDLDQDKEQQQRLSDPATLVPMVTRLAAWVGALGSWPLRFIAERSYGVYLLHVLCANALERLLGVRLPDVHPQMLYFLVVVTALAAAHVLHQTLELPAIQMGRRLARRWLDKAPARSALVATPQ
jgi:peptidoglycan/LPS O-acetylase OafA/YrhL